MTDTADALASIDATLTAQAVAKVRSLTQLSADDARGMLAVALSGDQSALQDLVDGYEAMGQAPDRSALQAIGQWLLAIEPYAAAGATILGLVAAAAAL